LLYVVNSSLITVIDGSTNNVLETIPAGANLIGLSVNQNTNLIYASDITNDVVYVIDGTNNEIMEVIKVGDHPIAVDINPETNTTYVVNEYSNSISVITS
jgi:YVTN family beta-propeller protein